MNLTTITSLWPPFAVREYVACSIANLVTTDRGRYTMQVADYSQHAVNCMDSLVVEIATTELGG